MTVPIGSKWRLTRYRHDAQYEEEPDPPSETFEWLEVRDFSARLGLNCRVYRPGPNVYDLDKGFRNPILATISPADFKAALDLGLIEPMI